MCNAAAAIALVVVATFAQPADDRSRFTSGDEFKAFVETLAALQPQLEDFQCEFEGHTVIKSEPLKQSLKLGEDGIAQRFSGLFLWTTRGDTYVNTLHQIAPSGSIQREQVIIRRSKDEAEEYVRHDNRPIGRGVIDRPYKIPTNREGCYGSIFLIDTLRQFSALGRMVFSATDDVVDGQRLKLLSISFENWSGPWQKFWIDLRRGGHVVRWESFARGGELVGRSDIELRSFPLGDQAVWMPVRGVIESHNAFKDGKAYYPAEPTSVETIQVVASTMAFNKHPGPETFSIKYKPGTPISDNLRKLEYEFGQQRPTIEPGTTMPRAEAEKMLNEAIKKAEQQKSELVVASSSEGISWISWLAWGCGAVLVAASTVLVIQRRRN
jgi:hypothetical protein